MEQYRLDQYGRVYVLRGHSYFHIGKLHGLSLAKFIEQYEEGLEYPEDY
jgi:hypothetical protein